MNDDTKRCEACGSNRVVAGLVDGRLDPAVFFFSELRDEPDYWRSFSISGPFPRAVSIAHGSASICLDCGAGNASFKVDLKDAKKVLEKWGTDALKNRLATGDTAV